MSKDKEDKVKFACMRSTVKDSKFRQDIKNSSKEFGFKTVGKSDKLFVFEAPIDLLSHATISKIQGKDWKNDNRVSLGGLSDKALARFLDDYNHVKEIVLFLDNDKVGLETAKKITEKYENDYKVSVFTSKEKDLNETLVKFKLEKETNKSVKINDFIKALNLGKKSLSERLKEKKIEAEKINQNREKDIAKSKGKSL